MFADDSPIPETPETPETPEYCALQLRSRWMGQPFGVVRFWGFSVVRPNDQSYVVVSVLAEADRLDLTLVHESRQGVAQVLSIWSPQGVRIDGAQGLVIARAARVSLGDCAAWSEDDTHYRVRTPRGEGSFPMQTAPALRLGC
jgi:hypothetical protein